MSTNDEQLSRRKVVGAVGGSLAMAAVPPARPGAKLQRDSRRL